MEEYRKKTRSPVAAATTAPAWAMVILTSPAGHGPLPPGAARRLDDGAPFIGRLHEDLRSLSSPTASLPLFQQQNLLSFWAKKAREEYPRSAAGCRRPLSSRPRYPLTLITTGGTPPPKAHGGWRDSAPPLPLPTAKGRGHTRCTGGRQPPCEGRWPAGCSPTGPAGAHRSGPGLPRPFRGRWRRPPPPREPARYQTSTPTPPYLPPPLPTCGRGPAPVPPRTRAAPSQCAGREGRRGGRERAPRGACRWRHGARGLRPVAQQRREGGLPPGPSRGSTESLSRAFIAVNSI